MKLAKTARAPLGGASPKTTRVPNNSQPSQANPAFTQGTHKERILAAIKTGHTKTSDIKRATGIKPNVLYADLGKLRSERVITATNTLQTTPGPNRSTKKKGEAHDMIPANEPASGKRAQARSSRPTRSDAKTPRN